MLIDRLAYKSRLRDVNPLIKTLFALVCVVICLCADSFAISGIITAVMLSLIIAVGKTPARDALHLMTIPAFFVIVASAAVAVSISASAENMMAYFRIGGIYIGIGDVIKALRVAAKCFGSVSCMYFLSLTTPMTELFALLRKSPLPAFITELTELIYRYIFVLYDAAERIRTAQESRLGYATLKSSYHSTARLAANIFIRAYRQADKTYTAMESRCYDGEIRLISREYDANAPLCVGAAAIAVIIAAVAVVCRRYGV